MSRLLAKKYPNPSTPDTLIFDVHKVHLAAWSPMVDGIIIESEEIIDHPQFLEFMVAAKAKYLALQKIANAKGILNQFIVSKDQKENRDTIQKLQAALDQNQYPLSEEFQSDIQTAINELAHGRKPAKNKRQSKKGYVYLIQSAEGYYKIGVTSKPKQRIETLGVKLPFPIDILHLIETDDMYAAEKSLHKRYAEKRVNGEWFELTDDDVAEICAFQKM